MKKYVLLLILVFVFALAIIIIPRFLSSNKAKTLKTEATNSLEQNKSVDVHVEESSSNVILGIIEESIIYSTIDTIQNKEHIQQESEFFDTGQMFFENIEVLYDYLIFDQIDVVKEKIQFYINTKMENVLDCYMDRESLVVTDVSIVFDISYSDKLISVIINTDNQGEAIDITILDIL